MGSVITSAKRVWLYAIVLLGALALACGMSPLVQSAYADYEQVTGTYSLNKDYCPTAYDDDVEYGDSLKVVDTHTVKVEGKYFWRLNESAYKLPDTVEIWRTDNSAKKTVRVASVPAQPTSSTECIVSISAVDDQVVAGKQDYDYAIVAVKEDVHEYYMISWWRNIGGVSYAPDQIKATKINNKQVWVYVDVSGYAVKNTTISVYAGTKKVKSFKPTASKTYKFVVKGSGMGKKKFKAVSKLNDDSSAKSMAMGPVKPKANVVKSKMKASLNDCAKFETGHRVIKAYCENGKLYADVWFYNSWRYTTKKNLKATIKINVDYKIVGKKTLKVSSLGPQKGKWFKKVCLAKKTVDLVNSKYVAIG